MLNYTYTLIVLPVKRQIVFTLIARYIQLITVNTRYKLSIVYNARKLFCHNPEVVSDNSTSNRPMSLPVIFIWSSMPSTF
jgi:hypothetical protein